MRWNRFDAIYREGDSGVAPEADLRDLCTLVRRRTKGEEVDDGR